MGEKVEYGQPHTLTLPSYGYKVKVKRPSVYYLIAAGQFPAELQQAAWDLVQSEGLRDQTKIEPALLQKYTEGMNALVPFVLVDPEIGPDTDLTKDDQGFIHGKIELEKLSDQDRQLIFWFGQGWAFSDDEKDGRAVKEATSQDVKPFRDGAASGDAGPGGEAVSPAAVEPGGAAAAVAGGA